MRFNATSYTRMSRAGIDIATGATTGFLFFMGVEVKAGLNLDTEAFLSFKTNMSSMTPHCKPRCPPAGRLVRTEVAPWENVLRAGAGKGGAAVPVAVSMWPLTQLLNDTNTFGPAVAGEVTR